MVQLREAVKVGNQGRRTRKRAYVKELWQIIGEDTVPGRLKVIFKGTQNYPQGVLPSNLKPQPATLVAPLV